jgi:hypothetical protein
MLQAGSAVTIFNGHGHRALPQDKSFKKEKAYENTIGFFLKIWLPAGRR